MSDSPEAIGIAAAQRDLRLDFFRGIAILIVLIDHVERINGVDYVKRWMPISLGFSDAAEGFVFLSGCVFGMANTSRLKQRGFRHVLRRTTVRSLQIWLGYVVTTIIVLGIASLSESVNSQVFRFSGTPMTTLSTILATAALSLNFQFPIHNILSMYAVILPLMAVILWVMRFSHAAGLALSLFFYLVAQVWPDLLFPAWPAPDRWFFNPLAWQFLFAIGMAAGSEPCIFAKRGWTKWLTVSVSATVLMIALVAMQASPESASSADWRFIIRNSDWLCDKSRLAPLRIVHFLAVVMVVRMLVSKTWNSGNVPRSVGWIVRIGQASLMTYCVGVVLTFVSLIVVQYTGTGVTALAMIHLDNAALTFCSAVLWLRLRMTSWKTISW